MVLFKENFMARSLWLTYIQLCLILIRILVPHHVSISVIAFCHQVSWSRPTVSSSRRLKSSILCTKPPHQHLLHVRIDHALHQHCFPCCSSSPGKSSFPMSHIWSCLIRGPITGKHFFWCYCLKHSR